MTRRRGALAVLAVLAAAGLPGCVRRYEPPAPGEPAALVKVKLTYDQVTAARAVPWLAHGARLVLEVRGREGHEVFAVAARDWPDALRAQAPLDVVPITVHAGREVTLLVRLAAAWSVTEVRTVHETEQVPRTVTRTESYYDALARTTRTRTVTATEWETRTRTVTKPVTTHQTAGCEAAVPLRPEPGAVYLVDYANLELTANCSATGFRQAGRPDGSFSLTPL